MAKRLLRCRIEQIASWHPWLFLQPHIVASVAVMSRYSGPPTAFQVECINMSPPWLGKATSFTLQVSWSEETAKDADRLRLTIQTKPLVELAAAALALVLARRVVWLGRLEVTDYEYRADYHSASAACVLETSGTETRSELGRRHREKVVQALANSFGCDAYVAVCAFSARGHRIRFSYHRSKESTNG